MKTSLTPLAFFIVGIVFMTGCNVNNNLQANPVEATNDQPSDESPMVLELTSSNFQTAVIENKDVTLIEFWAEWCGPCRIMNPIIEELAKDYHGKVAVGKINVDFNPEISRKYGIRSIPAILILKNGEVVDKHIGTTTMKVLANKVEAQL